MAESTSSAPNPDRSYSAAPDATKLRISAQRPFTRRALEVAITPWLEAANIESDKYSIMGVQEIARNFAIKFTGAAGLGKIFAENAFAALRLPSGEWRLLEATLPNGEKTKLFVSVDKSLQERTEEMGIKKLAQAMERLMPSRIISCDKRARRVFLEGIAVAQLSAPSRDRFVIRWHRATVEAYALDTAAIRAQFDQSLNGTAGEGWQEL